MVGDEVVVVGAEPGEELDGGLPGGCPGFDVVELEVGGAVAAGAFAVDAFALLVAALEGGGVAAGVDDVDDPGPVLEEHDDEGVAEPGADPVEVDGTDAVDLADRAVFDAAAQEGLEVDVDEGLGLGDRGAIGGGDRGEPVGGVNRPGFRRGSGYWVPTSSEPVVLAM